MKNKGCARWTVLLGMLALLLICIAAAGLVYFQARARAVNSRPLVLIHAPVNHDQVHVGDGVLVHATARADNGLRRIELWADNTFVDAQDAPEGSAPTMLVFSGNWTATAAGNHVLIVRAIAADGTEGQAAVTIEALAQEGADAGVHTVEEGETLETIAAEEGTTPEELAAANPDLGPGGPVPGDDLVIPDDEPPAPGGGAPPPGEEPPLPEDDPPGIAPSLLDIPLLLRAFPFGAGEPLGLRVEFLSLTTAAAYEQLHCYIGYADIPPRWFPDMDNDQSTDESFASAGAGAGGGTMWNVAGLAGDSMPVFAWPRNLDLSINVSCVGVAGGGTDSVELGRWEDSVPPERWTGVTLNGGVIGSYEFTYRIIRSESGGRGVPLYLDPDMTPPTNVRLDDRRISLRWDYNPRPDEEPIDGFRVYLNGSLQWTESADSRESMLPYEWFNPPCGAAYTFTVTAYRVGLPDGPESLPGIAVLRQPDEDCTREVLITFLTLETFDLGGDGRHEDRDGDVGPPYGYFFANEQQITFDGGALGSGGSLDRANGFTHNTVYDLGELAANSTWSFSGGPPVALLAAIPEGGAFEFGFRIMDEDSGRCRDSGDSGCDDLICEGLSSIYEEESVAAELDRHHEGTLTSEDGRCRVAYQWGPAAGSPVGSPESWEPLPWLDLEKIEIDDDTGRVRLHIRNTGTAAWPWRDLNIELQNREGVSLGVYTWEGFILEAGQRTVLEHPDMRLAAPPYDACVLIDPYDAVTEAYERSGALFHHPICPPTPDLTITDVRFEPAGAGGQVRVTIQNVGSERLENRAVEVMTYLPDWTPLYIGGSYPNITLEPFQTTTLNFGGVSESLRRQMRAGYRVVVNPQGRIHESNNSNNAFEVPAALPLVVTAVSATSVPEFEDLLYHFHVSVLSGTARQEIASWDITPDVPRGGILVPRPLFFDYNTGVFELMGDELLEIGLTADPREGDYARLRALEVFSAAEIRDAESDYRSSTGCERFARMKPAFVPVFNSLPGPESGDIATFVFAICGPMR